MIEKIAQTKVHKIITIPEDKTKVYKELKEFFGQNNIEFSCIINKGNIINISYIPRDNPTSMFSYKHNPNKWWNANMEIGKSYILDDRGIVFKFDLLNDNFNRLDFFHR